MEIEIEQPRQRDHENNVFPYDAYCDYLRGVTRFWLS